VLNYPLRHYIAYIFLLVLSSSFLSYNFTPLEISPDRTQMLFDNPVQCSSTNLATTFFWKETSTMAKIYDPWRVFLLYQTKYRLVFVFRALTKKHFETVVHQSSTTNTMSSLSPNMTVIGQPPAMGSFPNSPPLSSSPISQPNSDWRSGDMLYLVHVPDRPDPFLFTTSAWFSLKTIFQVSQNYLDWAIAALPLNRTPDCPAFILRPMLCYSDCRECWVF
jgi:hypothetical protein